MGMEKVISTEADEKNIRSIDFDIFYDIAWTMAKTADPTIKEPLAWLDTFEVFPIIEILPELQDMLAACITTQKKPLSPTVTKRAAKK